MDSPFTTTFGHSRGNSDPSPDRPFPSCWTNTSISSCKAAWSSGATLQSPVKQLRFAMLRKTLLLFRWQPQVWTCCNIHSLSKELTLWLKNSLILFYQKCTHGYSKISVLASDMCLRIQFNEFSLRILFNEFLNTFLLNAIFPPKQNCWALLKNCFKIGAAIVAN